MSETPAVQPSATISASSPQPPSTPPSQPTSTPLKPHWPQPSHPELIALKLSPNSADFTSSAHSLVALPAGALFCPLPSPPLQVVPHKAYSTIQLSRTQHAELNSDLIYVNHSCAPSLEFHLSELPSSSYGDSTEVGASPDSKEVAPAPSPSRLEVRVAHNRPLSPGDELTFFYPSSEWDMAQPFACRCGAPACLGWIAGAKQMGRERMRGFWLNAFIEELLDEEEAQQRAVAQLEAPVPLEESDKPSVKEKPQPSRCSIQ